MPSPARRIGMTATFLPASTYEVVSVMGVVTEVSASWKPRVAS